MMKIWTISAAALLLLAAPALAQPGDHPHGDRPGGGGGGGEHGGFHGGGHAPEARPAAAPHAAPPAATMRRQDFVRGGGDRPGNDNHGGDHNGPGRHDDNHGNFPGGHNGNAGNFHGGNDNRFDHNRPGVRPGGGRHDFSGFRNFHQNFTASRRFRAPHYRRPSGFYYHRWGWGEVLPSLFWSRDYWLDDYEEYDLPPPPPGAVWVRYGDDALLIDQDTGEVISAQYGVFY